MSDALEQIAQLEVRTGALEREWNVALEQIAALQERIKFLELELSAGPRRWARRAGASCGHPAPSHPTSRSRSSGRAVGGQEGAAAPSSRAEPCRPRRTQSSSPTPTSAAAAARDAATAASAATAAAGAAAAAGTSAAAAALGAGAAAATGTAAQSQTVDPGPPPPPENPPPPAVAPPPTPLTCTHHTPGNAYANSRVTVSSKNQVETQDELGQLFSHLHSTLFSGDDRGLEDLWWRVEEELLKKRIVVFSCTTKANRWVLIRCAACQQQVCVEHGKWVSAHSFAELRQRLFGFFANPPIVVDQGPPYKV